MKVNASCRFIGIMVPLFRSPLDFTCGCNLCNTTICQFTLKENEQIPNCATVNGLSYDTCPCSKVWPASSHFISTVMFAAKVWDECVLGLIVSDHERKHILRFKLGERKSRHIQNCDVLTHHQFHFGFSCTVP